MKFQVIITTAALLFASITSAVTVIPNVYPDKNKPIDMHPHALDHPNTSWQMCNDFVVCSRGLICIRDASAEYGYCLDPHIPDAA